MNQSKPKEDPDMTTETKPTGTQSIERAIHLLKLLSTRGNFGWGLTDLSRRSGLDKATVHRILGCLQHERLVERDVREHRYFPGPMLIDLGLSVGGYRPLLEAGRGCIERLARRSGGVGFFYLRSGIEFVVAGRVEHTAHRGMLNEVGFRRPLIMSAGGVAILLAMPADERAATVERNLRDLTSMGIPRLDRFERMLARSLELGYSANLEDVVPSIHSFSVAFVDKGGMPLGSLAIAGDPGRFPASAGRKCADLLSFEATELAARAPGHSAAPAPGRLAGRPMAGEAAVA
jgi:DNA-binding IclR family transcriptional regulator